MSCVMHTSRLQGHVWQWLCLRHSLCDRPTSLGKSKGQYVDMLVQETSLVEKTFKPQIEVKIPMVWSQEPPVPPFPLGCQNHVAGRDATPMDMFGVFARPESIRSNPCPDPTVQQLLCVVKPWGARHITPAWDLTKIWVNASKIIQQNPNTTRSSHQMCHGMSLPQVQKLMKIWGSQEENIRVRESKESPKRKEKGGNSESIIGLWAFQVGSTIKQTHHKARSFQSGHLEWSAAQSPIYCPFQLITWMFPLFQRNLEASISIHQPYSSFLLQGFEGHQNPINHRLCWEPSCWASPATAPTAAFVRPYMSWRHKACQDLDHLQIMPLWQDFHVLDLLININWIPGNQDSNFPQSNMQSSTFAKGMCEPGWGTWSLNCRESTAQGQRLKILTIKSHNYFEHNLWFVFFSTPFTIHSRKRCLSSPRRF